MRNSNNTHKFWNLDKQKYTYVEEDRPKRVFSFKGWNEKLPRNLATQSPSKPRFFWGQSLTYITTMNTAMLATTNTGISHDIHCLLEVSRRYKTKSWCCFLCSTSPSQNLHLQFSLKFPLFFGVNDWRICVGESMKKPKKKKNKETGEQSEQTWTQS